MNVYVLIPVNEVLIFDGFHVPVMPLVDVVGNAGALAFRQRVPIVANAGVTLLLIAIDLLPAEVQPALFFTVTFNVTEPDAPAVYLILLVPLPDAILPLLIVQV